MHGTATPKLAWYALLSGAGLFAAIAFQRPALAALAAPFALALAVGVARYRAPQLTASVVAQPRRAVEGDEITVDVTIASDRDLDRLEVLLVPQPNLVLAPQSNPVAVAVPSGRGRTVRFTGHPLRWGAFEVADVVVRARDRSGFFGKESRFVADESIRVYPVVEKMRHLVMPFDTQVFAGNQTAREKAEGIEFADMRPFVPGDRQRDVNWRVTARRGSLWVNQRHPERNADVVIFLDTFGDAHLDDAVRAATVLVSGYLQGRDRVGLISFGGMVRSLQPGVGYRQLYRIVDALVESRVFENMAWKGIEVLPVGVVPPKALVLAVSPLDDPRVVDALLDLRRRRHDVAVIEIAPKLVHAYALSQQQGGEVAELSWRLWQLERRAVRDRLLRLGVAVVEWPEVMVASTEDPMLTMPARVVLDAVGEELRAFRRRSRRPA